MDPVSNCTQSVFELLHRVTFGGRGARGKEVQISSAKISASHCVRLKLSTV